MPWVVATIDLKSLMVQSMLGGGQIGDSVKSTVKTSDEPKSRPTMSRYDSSPVAERVDRKMGGQGGRAGRDDWCWRRTLQQN